MRKSKIKFFKINGLFGDRDIAIPFDSDVKILIGENGLGKTTVLNILYYTLTNKLYKLNDFDFKSIEIKFGNKKTLQLPKEKLSDIEEDFSAPTAIVDELSRTLTSKQISNISNLFEVGASIGEIIDQVRFSGFGYRNAIGRKYPSRYLYNSLKMICGYGESDEQIKTAKEYINDIISDTEILYFPTFRRIEEDLINLGFNEDKFEISDNDSRLIQFGMRDVKHKLNEIKKEINQLSSKGLSQISSEILSQLVKGVPSLKPSAIAKISVKDIEIILARVGEAISKADKDKILEIVSEKEFKETDDKYLVYFLHKLVQIYEQQRSIDSSIENFVSVCNKYLHKSNKEIQYEASEVEFYLASTLTEKRVLLSRLLSKLSSGEKQIISLFSRIYLSGDTNFIVLFDEPELSLSIFWQKMLLPHIVESDKCKFLLAVTHSPFIFENHLEKNAIGLNQYIKNY
ncbi:AAA family ATPase [Salinimicrobium sp. GXAS 041]|uniref:AAA family ATPase n=1 Tax=Salinimicrobium sp. GXAS 041 TaxID=3400806 RepID=UPI003C7198AD